MQNLVVSFLAMVIVIVSTHCVPTQGGVARLSLRGSCRFFVNVVQHYTGQWTVTDYAGPKCKGRKCRTGYCGIKV